VTGRRVLAGLTLATAGGVLAAGGVPATAAVPGAGQVGEASIVLKAGPGHDITAARCAICHSLDYIPANAPAMNRAGWDKTIQKMRKAYGAPITDEEAQQILEYLAGNYSGKP
jgi:sulfite dehydrogenase (cytochrome) subunit B